MEETISIFKDRINSTSLFHSNPEFERLKVIPVIFVKIPGNVFIMEIQYGFSISILITSFYCAKSMAAYD